MFSRRGLVSALIVVVVAAGIGVLTREKKPDDTSPTPQPPSSSEMRASGSVNSGDSPTNIEDERGTWRPEPVRTRISQRFELVPATLTRPAAVRILAPQRAPVGEILVHEGDAVEKGQVLIRLLGTGFEKSLAEAIKSGDAERKRTAEAALANLDVKAPEAGAVFRVMTSLGDLPINEWDPDAPGKTRPGPLLLLFDWRGIEVKGTAPPELADLFKPDLPVLIRFDPSGSRDGIGVVTASESSEDGSVRFTVKPSAPPPIVPDPDVPSGVLVPVGEQEILIVSNGAIRRSNGRDVVDVVPVSGKPVERVITRGISYDDGMVQILSGLDRYESVVVVLRPK
jgi:multidrug efflux pump subunit AcrA (membrane-fusion protein)